MEATCLASEPGSAASTWGAWGWWSTRFVLCFPICKMRMLRVFTSQGSHIACKVLGVASDTYEGLSSGSLLTRPSFLGAGSCCLRDGGWVRLRVLALLNCRPSEYSSALVIGRMKLGCGVSTQRREGKIRQTGHRRSETWAKCFQEKLPWNKTSHTGSGHRLMRGLGFPCGSVVKNLPAMQETRVGFLGQEDPLEEEMATHSNILAWRIPWTEEPGGLQSMGSQKS